MKRVYKYPTGAEVPEGSKYLYTREEKTKEGIKVWHYFLVETHGMEFIHEIKREK